MASSRNLLKKAERYEKLIVEFTAKGKIDTAHYWAFEKHRVLQQVADAERAKRDHDKQFRKRNKGKRL